MGDIMDDGNSLSPIQAGILWELYQNDTLSFSALNADKLSSDQFSYHLRRLSQRQLIEKTSDGSYRLTVMGRSKAILLDGTGNQRIIQGYLACRLVISKIVDGVEHLLMQERQRVPFKGYLAEPGGKILYGEDMQEAAERNLMRECGLACPLQLKGMIHIKDHHQGNVVQDKYFVVFRGHDPSGTFTQSGMTGHNRWMTREQIATADLKHKGVDEIISIADGASTTIVERSFSTDHY